jgi:hypothetical protein
MYPHICDEMDRKVYPFVDRMVRNRYQALRSLSRVRRARDIARIAKRKIRSILRRMGQYDSNIFVEPTGLFAAEWFAKKFDAHVVVVLRHPANFVSSLTKLGWGFDFADFSRQEILMDKYLKGLKGELANPPQRPDILGMGILQWKVIYTVIKQLQKEHPEWVFVRQEDLAANPVEEFKKVYQRLGLEFNAIAEETIRDHSSAKNPAELSSAKDDSKRNSEKTIQIWKSRLTAEEASRIRQSLDNLYREFYDESSWA